MKSIGQSCSALSTSSLQDLSAVGSSHSLSEAVFDLSLALFRLVCSLHAVAPPSNDRHLFLSVVILFYRSRMPYPDGFTSYDTIYYTLFQGCLSRVLRKFLGNFQYFLREFNNFYGFFLFLRLPIFSAYCFAACSILFSPNS